MDNHESQRRRYGLADRARQLIWTTVEIIDDDLGGSAGGINRPGFERQYPFPAETGCDSVDTQYLDDGESDHIQNGKIIAMGKQEGPSPKLMSSAWPVATVWIGLAFSVALGLAALVLAALGPEERGTVAALQVSARFSFLLFWLAYTAGAMTTLFGPVFEPLKRRAREFGLAFASAHLVHLALVAWLTLMGHAPSRGVFVFFGIAVLWTYLLALFSIPRLQKELGAKGWWFLRVVGLNYIAYAFAKDFLQYPQFENFKYLVGYLPFAVLSVLGPVLCLAAFAQRAARLQRTS